MKANNLYSRILKKTENFHKPSIIGKVTDDNFINDDDIKEIFVKMNSNRKVKPSLRVFVNDATRDMYMNLILANPPSEDEKLEDWGRRIFADNEYCIILNKAEMWSDNFVRKTLSIFNEVLSNFGYNEFDHELMLFIGNYQYTPFGVHIDGEGDNSLQLNIQGETRKAYLWTPENYQELTGKKSTPHYFPSKIIEQADYNFDLIKNELFILPASQYFHVYSNSGFNISLAYFLKKKPKTDVLQSILKSFDSELSSNINDEINLSNFIQSKDLIELVKKDFEAVDFDFDLNYRLENIKQKRISNLGFTSEPIHQETIFSFDEDCKLLINSPFNIVYSVMLDVLHVYLRGKCFKYNNNANVVDFIIEILHIRN